MPRPRILLIDDNQDFLKIAAEFLELNGYEVFHTTDLAEGRRLLEEDSFAVAFLDVNFDIRDDHDKRGLALAIETIGTSSVPKVILTVHGEFEYARESLMPRWGKAGAAVEYLHKKDGLQQMVETIERIVQRVRVFLSYASPDRARVRALYDKLQMSGFLPWMDIMELEAGEDWEMAVRNAIRKTDFAIVCLSHGSIDRRGYYQDEILLILKILREQPPGKIFVIPARFEDCEIIHDELRALHWVDLFQPDGYEKLVRALKEGISRRGKES